MADMQSPGDVPATFEPEKQIKYRVQLVKDCIPGMGNWEYRPTSLALTSQTLLADIYEHLLRDVGRVASFERNHGLEEIFIRYIHYHTQDLVVVSARWENESEDELLPYEDFVKQLPVTGAGFTTGTVQLYLVVKSHDADDLPQIYRTAVKNRIFREQRAAAWVVPNEDEGSQQPLHTDASTVTGESAKSSVGPASLAHSPQPQQPSSIARVGNEQANEVPMGIALVRAAEEDAVEEKSMANDPITGSSLGTEQGVLGRLDDDPTENVETVTVMAPINAASINEKSEEAEYDHPSASSSLTEPSADPASRPLTRLASSEYLAHLAQLSTNTSETQMVYQIIEQEKIGLTSTLGLKLLDLAIAVQSIKRERDSTEERIIPAIEHNISPNSDEISTVIINGVVQPSQDDVQKADTGLLSRFDAMSDTMKQILDKLDSIALSSDTLSQRAEILSTPLASLDSDTAASDFVLADLVSQNEHVKAIVEGLPTSPAAHALEMLTRGNNVLSEILEAAHKLQISDEEEADSDGQEDAAKMTSRVINQAARDVVDLTSDSDSDDSDLEDEPQVTQDTMRPDNPRLEEPEPTFEDGVAAFKAAMLNYPSRAKKTLQPGIARSRQQADQALPAENKHLDDAEPAPSGPYTRVADHSRLYEPLPFPFPIREAITDPYRPLPRTSSDQQPQPRRCDPVIPPLPLYPNRYTASGYSHVPPPPHLPRLDYHSHLPNCQHYAPAVHPPFGRPDAVAIPRRSSFYQHVGYPYGTVETATYDIPSTGPATLCPRYDLNRPNSVLHVPPASVSVSASTSTSTSNLNPSMSGTNTNTASMPAHPPYHAAPAFAATQAGVPAMPPHASSHAVHSYMPPYGLPGRYAPYSYSSAAHRFTHGF